mgnify:CR=1 FL=1|jgi:hypothetical protein|tara:strand:+ start:393 stop:602 length:210 start_codon:yes stop_codon:yes gene_type:complete
MFDPLDPFDRTRLEDLEEIRYEDRCTFWDLDEVLGSCKGPADDVQRCDECGRHYPSGVLLIDHIIWAHT